MTKSQQRKIRKQIRQKQRSKSYKLRKKLIKGIAFAPCYYCKGVFMIDVLTLEHIIPLCLGGTNDMANLTLACRPCNQSRGRESWFLKQEINKKYYEQYHSQHRKQDEPRPLQDPGTPSVYCQGESV